MEGVQWCQYRFSAIYQLVHAITIGSKVKKLFGRFFIFYFYFSIFFILLFKVLLKESRGGKT
jgi:hypothetical protein